MLINLNKIKINFADVDGDSYGNSKDSQIEVCMGEGFSESNNDCDDTNALIYPGTSNICYTGPQGTDNVGTCKSGEETCLVSGLFSGCVGEVLP